ncbi:hypothetical protein CLUG_00628 [Clavispora lusitaniae ATCC 42720]|uniref:Uncharacterized protein n=1 Tax=Clavispora lusitaniae (strain ATCC 42720) TaxID=306902 RepID=C4XXF5_CLAL4|nr:uncharacterized protein CLUG_00628 [Clavispora lusitaniae ATCC 42720]EEQ36505.1 hypothetical protein CLUG_00628 [Clavispora lusitaniae ATCC 42720]
MALPSAAPGAHPAVDARRAAASLACCRSRAHAAGADRGVARAAQIQPQVAAAALGANALVPGRQRARAAAHGGPHRPALENGAARSRLCRPVQVRPVLPARRVASPVSVPDDGAAVVAAFPPVVQPGGAAARIQWRRPRRARPACASSAAGARRRPRQLARPHAQRAVAQAHHRQPSGRGRRQGEPDGVAETIRAFA